MCSPTKNTPTTDSPDRRILLGAAGLAGAAFLGALSSHASAGPLSPPAGTVSSTGKTLTEVEPRTAINATNTPPAAGYVFRITQPGSYYLTGNINVPAGQQGILVSAPATIDLNGFSITGGNGNTFGIASNNGGSIRNGVISGFAYGLSVDIDAVIEDITVDACTTRSVIMGTRSIIRRCNFRGLVPVAVECSGDYALVEDSFFTGATVQGAYLNSYSTLRHCRFGACSTGAYIGYGGRVERCSFDACSSRGLQAGARSFVDGCTATGSPAGALNAIELGEGSTITRCVVSANPVGIWAGAACRITDCSMDANTTAIRLTATGSVVDACKLTRNTTGIDLANVTGHYITRCIMLGNTNALAINWGGNWYPYVPLGDVNTATNPLASMIG